MCQKWWVDGSDATTKYLQQKFRLNSDVILEATAEQEVLMLELRQVRERKKEFETREAEIKNEFMQVIGDASSLKTRYGRIDWKAPNGSTVAWKEVAEEAEVPAEIIARHSTPMSRRFVPYFNKK